MLCRGCFAIEPWVNHDHPGGGVRTRRVLAGCPATT
jgi:hypothetical protein